MITFLYEGLSGFSNLYAKLTIGRFFSSTKAIQRVYRQVLLKKNAFRINFEGQKSSVKPKIKLEIGQLLPLKLFCSLIASWGKIGNIGFRENFSFVGNSSKYLNSLQAGTYNKMLLE